MNLILTACVAEFIITATTFLMWGYSSVGRALEWHSRGRRFDPDYLHHLLGPKWHSVCSPFYL